MRRSVAAILVVAAAVLTAPGARAYLKIGTRVGPDIVSLRWKTFPVRYLVTNRDARGVTAPQLQAAFQKAFDTWAHVTTAGVSAQSIGFTSADPGDDDGISVVGFLSRPDLDRTLAATTFEVDDLTGELLASDIFVNTAFDWSVSATGESARFDLQSVATHEIGHLFGLGHSQLGETAIGATGGRGVIAKRAVMFPIAYPRGNIADRALQADDIAGIGDIYQQPVYVHRLGSITGRVTLGGHGVFGAHVTAFNPKTGTLVAGFTLDDQGRFTIAGLTPGAYVVRAEPLDDADLDSFFEEDTVVNVDFVPAYFGRLVSVPGGGTPAAIEIKVAAK
jgi:predicted Zn-dependent protease